MSVQWGVSPRKQKAARDKSVEWAGLSHLVRQRYWRRGSSLCSSDDARSRRTYGTAAGAHAYGPRQAGGAGSGAGRGPDRKGARRRPAGLNGRDRLWVVDGGRRDRVWVVDGGRRDRVSAVGGGIGCELWTEGGAMGCGLWTEGGAMGCGLGTEGGAIGCGVWAAR